MTIALRKCNVVLLLFAIAFCTAAQAEDSGAVRVPPINTSATPQPLPGKIIWHDLLTTNTVATQNFYADLFGWQFKTYGSGRDTYIYVSYKGKPIGGIVPLTAQHATENDNQWVSYISVTDVAQATRFVENNGGKVLLNPINFEQQGELAVFTDPQGALFGVMNSSSGDPVDGRINPGEWIWADLMVKDPTSAIRFYQGIANYKAKEYTRDPKFKEFYLYTGIVARAGVAALPTDELAAKILPNWLPYVYVENVNAAVVKTPTLGGSVILKPASQVYNGKIAVIADPGGAALGLIELTKTTKK